MTKMNLHNRETSREQLKRQKHTKQTYSERAIAILTKGAMPLCPPARRNWGSVLVQLVIPVGETSFSWPPFGLPIGNCWSGRQRHGNWNASSMDLSLPTCQGDIYWTSICS